MSRQPTIRDAIIAAENLVDTLHQFLTEIKHAEAPHNGCTDDEPCDLCNASNAVEEALDSWGTCSYCAGDGSFADPDGERYGICPECNGLGRNRFSEPIPIY